MSIRSRMIALALIGALAGLPSFAQAQAAKPPAAGAATTPAPAAKAGEPLDLNTATKQQLMTLDGIGDARSDAIIKGRPYRAKNEIVDKNIVPSGVYDKIKDQIIAKQATAAAPSAPTKK